MKCSNCGFDNKDTAKFCKSCGQEISAIEEENVDIENVEIDELEDTNTEENNTKNKVLIPILATLCFAVLAAIVVLLVWYFNVQGRKARIIDVTNNIVQLLNAGNYDEAFKYIDEIDLDFVKNNFSFEEFNTISNVIEQAQIEDQKEELKNLKVGQTVKFGIYTQKSGDAGTEDLEWVVVNKRSNSDTFLLCKSVIDVKAYNDKEDTSSWANSTLRKWLNTNFYQDAFSDYAKDKMLSCQDYTSHNSLSEIDYIENHTNSDKVSLMSESQIKEYFTNDEAKHTEFSDYAKDKSKSSKYWTRAADKNSEKVNVVDCDTGIVSKSDDKLSDKLGVRPLICVNFNNNSFEKLSVQTKDNETIDMPNVEELKDFLLEYGSYAYDCENPTETSNDALFNSSDKLDILSRIISPAMSCVNYVKYPTDLPKCVDKYSTEFDPLSKSSYKNGVFQKWDQKSVDWILHNVFNVKESEINSLVNKYLGKSSNDSYKESGYLDKGYYYSQSPGGFGGGSEIKIKLSDAKLDGEYYTIKCVFENVFGNKVYSSKTMYAKVELKDYEGYKYWSLHKLSNSEIK